MKPPIPDIYTDVQLVETVDELKFRLKTSTALSKMRYDFLTRLNQFIKDWGLDGDPHTYATLPRDHKETH